MPLDRDYARQEMLGRHSAELLEILVDRNEEEWSPEIFAIVEEVLHERGVPIADELARLRAERSEAERPAVDLRPVADFEVEHDADLCRLTLAEAGIRALVQPAPDADPPAAPAFQVLVAETDIENANQVLDDALVDSEDGGEATGHRCPSCGFTAEPLSEDGRLVCQVCGADIG
jgi:hypothetical protein